MRRSRRTTSLTAVAALAMSWVGLTACDERQRTVALVEMTAATSDEDPASYSFTMSSTLHAGWTEFSLINADDEEHHAQLFRLNEGTTFDELVEAVASGDPAGGLELATPVGGTSLVAPGTSSQANAVIDLEPGTYAVICLVPDADGNRHVAHGMAHELEVTGSDDSAPPPSDDEVQLLDYAFDLQDQIDGESTLEVTNSGNEPHEMVLAQLDDGASIDDVVAAVQDGTPPPTTPVGGLQAIAPGSSVRLQLHLPPGRYVAICFVPSSEGSPHLTKGMIREVAIT